jgi:zinc transporter ZupT
MQIVRLFLLGAIKSFIALRDLFAHAFSFWYKHYLYKHELVLTLRSTSVLTVAFGTDFHNFPNNYKTVNRKTEKQ